VISGRSVADRVADEFLHRLLQGLRAKRLVNPTAEEKFECPGGNREIETAFTEPGEFFGYNKQRNFAMSIWRKRLEDEFLIEASDQFRAKEKIVDLVGECV
jgi:hypothetical protein